MKDGIVLVVLLLSFATLLTTHLAIVVRLCLTEPRYRGVVAFFVPPLAPVWAHAQEWRALCWIWVGAVVSYAGAVGAAQF